MERDPVVDEMRSNGARIAEECDGDIHKMADRFRREQEQHGGRIVRRRPPPPQPKSVAPRREG
ncbi:MAG: hypothetical protein HOP29_02255 [Phycisphaerales bacterium]|nr:hypothetical protein [Phycisphaerales bacterium]